MKYPFFSWEAERQNKWLLRFHFVAAAWWGTGGVALALLYPKSVLYVSLMSSWANFVAHFAACMSGRAEMRTIQQETES